MAEKTFHSITLPGQDTARVPLTAAEFSTSVAYQVKDYCTYQGKLYRCTTAHAAGAWNAAHFTETNVDAEFDRKLDIPASQASAPANPRVGDLWIDNDENSPIYNVDASPTLNSTNAVQSGGTKVALNSLDSRKMEHGVITGDFSASVDYRVGDLVFYATTANGITTRTLYRCTTDHNSAAWNAAHFTATTLEVELQRVRDNEADTDMIGDLFGTKTTYAVGDYCIYNDNLYRCIQAVDNTGATTPAFDPEDWTQVALANNVSDLNSALMHKIAGSADFTFNGYINGDGILMPDNNYRATDYLVIDNHKFRYDRLYSFQYCYIVLYGENKEKVDSLKPSDTVSLAYVAGDYLYNGIAKYARFCTYVDDVSNANIYLYNDLKYEVIGEENLLAESVTLEKCAFAGHDPESNYVDTTKIIADCYIQANGIPKTGQNGFAATDFIPVEAGMVLYSYHLLGGYCAFYKEDKTVLQGYDYGTLPFPITVIANAKYVRFTTVTSWWPDTSEIWLFTRNEVPKPYAFGLNAHINNTESGNPCDYIGNEICVFNKICCIGDSITSGTFNHNEGGSEQYAVFQQYSYPTYLKKMYGVDTVNWGIGGYTSVEWWNAKKDDDFGGFDCAIINLGINDVAHSVSSSDTETAIMNIINALKSANNNIKIFIATIVPAYSNGVTTYDTINELIRDIAGDTANCYLVDLTEYGHAKKGTAYEAGHLTALGYRMLAQDYGGAIGYTIRHNIDEFKWVQFIGTNYSEN